MVIGDVSCEVSYEIQWVEHSEVRAVTGVELIRPVYDLAAIASRASRSR